MIEIGKTCYYVEILDFNCIIDPVIIEKINLHNCVVGYTKTTNLCATIPHQLLHETLDDAKKYAIAILNRKIKTIQDNIEIIEKM